MNFLERTNDEARRIHKNFTKELTVYNYSWDESGGSNAYADGDWTRTTSTVEGTVRLPESVAYEDNSSGAEANHDVNIYVAPDELDLTTTGGGDETRATEFEDENGRRYKAIGFHDESSLYQIQCREVQ